MARISSSRILTFASLVLFSTLVSSAPIPKATEFTSEILTRQYDVLSLKPRFSSADNMVGTAVLPRSGVVPVTSPLARRNTRIPARNLPSADSEPFVAPKLLPYPRDTGSIYRPRRSFSSTFEPTQEPTAAPTPAPENQEVKRARIHARDLKAANEQAWEVLTRAVEEREVEKRDPQPDIQNSPIGATNAYSGKLWRKGLKREASA